MSNRVEQAIKSKQKVGMITKYVVVLTLVAFLTIRIATKPEQAPLIVIALVIVALIVAPVLITAFVRQGAQKQAIAERAAPGALIFASPLTENAKAQMKMVSNIIGRPISGKGLMLALTVSVEPDGIHGWYGGKKLQEAFFFPRERIVEIVPYFNSQGARVFPAIAVAMDAPQVEDPNAEAGVRASDVVPVISVGEVPNGFKGYERAETTAIEAARILGVPYVSPEAVEARAAAENV